MALIHEEQCHVDANITYEIPNNVMYINLNIVFIVFLNNKNKKK